MAVTTFATGDALTAKIWSKDWIDSSIDRSYFKRNGFIGEDEDNSIIWLRRDLQNQKGDTIYLGNVQELSNAGITGDNMMEGSEETLDTYDDALIIDQVRNAVRLEGQMTIQRAATDLRKYIRNVLRNWMANKIDNDIFTALELSPTRVFYGGTATSTATVASTSYFLGTVLSKARVNAQKTTPEIRPIMADGVEVFVCVAAPESHYYLKIGDTTLAGYLQNAMPRGAKNPLWTMAHLYWDGVVVHMHRHVATADNWGSGSNVKGATNLFMGAHAGAIGYAKNRIWKEKLFDYDNSPGVCVGSIFGVTKLVFNSEDSAVEVLRTARTDISEGT